MVQERLDNLDAYMGLSNEDIVRLVLCLLIEEGLSRELAAFRSHQLAPEPVEGREKLLVGRNHIVPVCNRAG